MDKMLFFVSFFGGAAHGYCHARNIPLQPAIHSTLTYGGAVVCGAVDGSVGARAGREYGFVQSLKNGALGTATIASLADYALLRPVLLKLKRKRPRPLPTEAPIRS